MPLTVQWNPSLGAMQLVEEEIKHVVKQDARAYYEDGMRKLAQIDTELKKGYAILNEQWGLYWQHYLVLGRGVGGGYTLAKMRQVAMKNMEKWQKLYHQREILRQKLKQPRVYTTYFSDRPFG